MSDPKPKYTPCDMGLDLSALVSRCTFVDGSVGDAVVTIDAALANRLNTAATFLLLIDPFKDQIKTMLAGGGRRRAA